VTPYITSDICGECFRSLFDTRQCYTIMARDVKKLGLTLSKAAEKLGHESKNCQMCHPQHCWDHYFNNTNANTNSTQQQQPNYYGSGHKSKYWRFDTASPKFTNPITLTLPSIPDELRMPPSRFHDIGAYFTEKFEFATKFNKSMDYLVEYNPGIVAIPTNMKPNLPTEATYLLSLRVTPANNCFSTKVYEKLPQTVWDAVYYTSTNHLGLALLDENYQMLPGYDVVIELDVPLDLKRSTDSKAGDSVSPTFMDYRIFLLNDRIYLHANADTVVVSPLSLRAKGYGDYVEHTTNTDHCAFVAEEAGGNGSWDKPCLLHNLYGGTGLQVTLLRQFNTVWSGGSNGKNYALFAVPDATDPGGNAPDSIYAEIDIFPHRIQRILPDEHDRISKGDVFGLIWKKGTKKRRNFKIDRVNMRRVREVGNATKSEDALPPRSFWTVDAHEDWFPGEPAFKESAHGGACCVLFSEEEVNLGGERKNHDGSLLVGVGHTKVIWRPWYSKKSTPQEAKDKIPHTHYVTLFYAFDPFPPFRIRARSGYFCLGHTPLGSNPNEQLAPTEGGAFNPHSVLTRNRSLSQNNIIFNCPQMSFVSSFAPKVGDSSRTIVGYGLNDCTGRLVEVEKREIVRLLYPDPMDMIFEG